MKPDGFNPETVSLIRISQIQIKSHIVDMVDIKQNQLIPIGSVIFPKRGGAIATNKKRKVIKPIIIDLNTMAIIPSDKLHTDFFYFWIFHS